jgi:hypothetical protein
MPNAAIPRGNATRRMQTVPMRARQHASYQASTGRFIDSGLPVRSPSLGLGNISSGPYLRVVCRLFACGSVVAGREAASVCAPGGRETSGAVIVEGVCRLLKRPANTFLESGAAVPTGSCLLVGGRRKNLGLRSLLAGGAGYGTPGTSTTGGPNIGPSVGVLPRVAVGG